jgi:hypothetical protein
MKSRFSCACLLFALLLLSGCPHGTPNETGVYATNTQILLADQSGAAVPLSVGQPLQSGQIFAVTLQLTYPAHVYVIHRRGGTLSDLYPGLGVADRELSEGVVRLPGNDQWMRVPTLTNQSQLCVLLSSSVIPSDLRRCNARRQNRPGQLQIQTLILY